MSYRTTFFLQKTYLEFKSCQILKIFVSAKAEKYVDYGTYFQIIFRSTIFSPNFMI